MNKLIRVALIISLVFAVGCVKRPPRPPATAPETRQPHPEPLVSAEFFDQKIRHLEKTTTNADLSIEQRELAGRLADSYRFIRNTSVLPRSDGGDRRIIQELLQTLSLVEEQCFAVKPAVGPSAPPPFFPAEYLERRNAVLEAYLENDFERVVRLTRGLVSDYGPDAITGKVGLAYVLSLAQQDMVEEAISTAKMLENQEQSPLDRVLLKTKMAQWQLDLGLREKAESAYSELSRSLRDHQKELDQLGRGIAQTPEKPSGESETVVRQPVAPPPPAREGAIGQLLGQVDDFVAKNRFDEAREVLISARKEASSTADSLALERALADVDASEEKYLSQRIALISKKKDALEISRKLIEEEKYEQARATLEALETEQGQAPEIKALKRQAVEKHIQQERNRAAKLFLQARQSDDMEKKAEYLRTSRDILKSLLDEYPLSNLNIKIKSNIEVVEKEMSKLGLE